MIRNATVASVCLGWVFLASAARGQADDAAMQQRAESIYTATGVQGGLIVHLGCGDGQLTAALHKGDSYVVHGLETAPALVQQARKTIRSLDRYGPVSVEEKQDISSTPLLLAISAADGSELARCPLPAAPVFNGIAAAGGELFLVLENGQLLCMTSKDRQKNKTGKWGGWGQNARNEH